MKITATKIPDVLKVELRRFSDDRGYFMESYRAAEFSQAVGQEVAFVQDNHSHSVHKNTVRGLHYQNPPHAQGKLVRCTRGAVVDVAVDFRLGSPTYGQWVSEVLSEDNMTLLWVPAGFLHGFATLVADCEVQYKCTDYYAGDCDANIAWNDPELAIDWGVSAGFEPEAVVLSQKDADAPLLSHIKSPFTF